MGIIVAHIIETASTQETQRPILPGLERRIFSPEQLEPSLPAKAKRCHGMPSGLVKVIYILNQPPAPLKLLRKLVTSHGPN
jgi:hypothetical protein